MSKVTLVEELNYEQALDELSKIVEDLESGDHPLDESVKRFERGQKLAVRCAHLLKEAEVKVREISDSGELIDT